MSRMPFVILAVLAWPVLAQTTRPSLLVPHFVMDDGPNPRTWVGRALRASLAGEMRRQQIARPVEVAEDAAAPTDTAAALSLAGALQADLVLVGRVEMEDQDLVVSGTLYDAAGKSLGRIAAGGTMEDFIAVYDRVSGQLAELIRATLPPEPAVVTAPALPAPVARPVHAVDVGLGAAPPMGMVIPAEAEAGGGMTIVVPVYVQTGQGYISSWSGQGWMTVNRPGLPAPVGPAPGGGRELIMRGTLTAPPIGAGAPPYNAAGTTPLDAQGRFNAPAGPVLNTGPMQSIPQPNRVIVDNPNPGQRTIISGPNAQGVSRGGRP
jgi:hypothetical protein